LVTVWRVKQVLLLGLAFAVVLALSFISVAKPAEAQVVVSGEVLNVLVDVEQGECGTGGCAEGERPVTVTPILSLNTELAALLTAAQEQAILDAAAAVAIFGEVTITDSAGAVVATVDPGETVCLEPGDFTASSSVVNAGVTADAALDALAGLGLGIDLSALVADVLVIEEPFVVAECPGGGPGGGGGGGDQNFGDITLEECSAIINNNTGAQYSPEINQRCVNIIDNGGGGDDNGGGGDDNGDVTNITIDINGDGFIDEDDAIDLNGDGIFDAADLEIAEAGATGTASASADAASASPASDDDGSGDDGSSDDSDGSSDDVAAAATGGTATLPETGGASLIALGAGALLVAGGLLARRIVR